MAKQAGELRAEMAKRNGAHERASSQGFKQARSLEDLAIYDVRPDGDTFRIVGTGLKMDNHTKSV